VLDFYRTQSVFSDPGAAGPWLDGMATDLAALRAASACLVFHYRAHGDIADHGFAPERMAEINLRYADAMFARLRELNPGAPGADRPATERLVGCCRDFTLLFVAMARHHGIPARARVGFATYFVPGWAMDHVIAEVWDGRRWRLVEPEVAAGHVDPADETPLDVLDVPRDRFLTGPEAWRACRSGERDASRFVVAPELTEPFLRGWPYLLHNLVLDLAALNKHEMILWDGWGVMAGAERVDGATAARMDGLAAVLADPAAGLDAIRAAFAADDLRVPPVVTSLAEPGGPLTQVSLRT
jgi:hypothetical protein